MGRTLARSVKVLAGAALLVAFALALKDWKGVTPTYPHMKPPPGHGPFTGTVADWPLWFPWHYFGGYCFDTQVCEISYAGSLHGSERPQPSVASYDRPMERIIRAGWGPYRNFPEPAVVTWVTKAGIRLHAEVDMSAIFADRLVHHTVAREDISDRGSIPYPGIILVVEDRALKVYMRTRIDLKESATRGDRMTHVGLVLVTTKTY
jgi:hypothetical protein